MPVALTAGPVHRSDAVVKLQSDDRTPTALVYTHPGAPAYCGMNRYSEYSHGVLRVLTGVLGVSTHPGAPAYCGMNRRVHCSGTAHRNVPARTRALVRAAA